MHLYLYVLIISLPTTGSFASLLTSKHMYESVPPPKVDVEEHLHQWLTSYSMIDSARILHRRSIDSKAETVHFVALNRTFHLLLEPALPQSVSANMSVIQLDSSTQDEPNILNAANFLTDFYSGRIDGDPASHLHGYRANNQLMCTVHTGAGEILNMEPLSLLTGNLSETRMLVYYESNIKDSPEGATCGFRNPPTPPPPRPTNHRKRRRSSSSEPLLASSGKQQQQQQQQPLVCPLQLVADHSFYWRLGFGQIGATVRAAVKIVDDVNAIYRATRFVNPDTGEALPQISFELDTVRVYSSPSSKETHFNAPVKATTIYTALHVLEAFGDFAQNGINFTAHCLNHLLTYRRMKRSVLGLAYFQSPCYPGFMSRSGRAATIAMNAGLSSYCYTNGYPLLFRQAVMVTAHELGHNLGSKHDPDSAECGPSPLQGGRYIMYALSVPVRAPNHDKFSPCSIKQITSFMKDNLHGCLRPPTSRLCGNHRLDSREECDAGLMGDACCTGDCRLRPGANCSDANSACCSSCKVAARGTACLHARDGAGHNAAAAGGLSALNPCAASSTYGGLCDGVSSACPRGSPMTANSSTTAARDGAVCWFGIGRCRNATCESACPHSGQACECPNAADACWLCCSSGDGGADGSCARLAVGIAMPAGTPCGWGGGGGGGYGGRCLGNGTCAPDSGRLWSSSADGGRAMLARLFGGQQQQQQAAPRRSASSGFFARNNMVFIVLAVCLMLYVPLCLLLRYRDKLLLQAQHGEIELPGDDDRRSAFEA